MMGGAQESRRGKVRKMVGFRRKSSGPSICKGRGLHKRQLGLHRSGDHLLRGVEIGGCVGQYGWYVEVAGVGPGLGLISEDNRSRRLNSHSVKKKKENFGKVM